MVVLFSFHLSADGWRVQGSTAVHRCQPRISTGRRHRKPIKQCVILRFRCNTRTSFAQDSSTKKGDGTWQKNWFLSQYRPHQFSLRDIVVRGQALAEGTRTVDTPISGVQPPPPPIVRQREEVITDSWWNFPLFWRFFLGRQFEARGRSETGC